MKKIYLLLALLSLSSIGWSQSVNDTLQKFKPGIYKSFSELKSNQPSIPLKYKVIKERVRINIITGEKIELYKLDIDKKEMKKNEQVFGFSDGINIYIGTLFYKFYKWRPEVVERSVRLAPRSHFALVESVGILYYFEDMGFNAMSNSNGGYGGNSRYIRKNILDTRTGIIYELSKGVVREVIADDKSLLDAFNNEKQKKRNMEHYIKLYNDRKRGDYSESLE
ncbi:MAG: hypothetical protein QM727_13260 [Niabella sp.]